MSVQQNDSIAQSVSMGLDGENIQDSMDSRIYAANKAGTNVQQNNIHDQGIVAGNIACQHKRKPPIDVNKSGETQTSPSKSARKEKTTTLKQLAESQTNLFTKCTNILHEVNDGLSAA